MAADTILVEAAARSSPLVASSSSSVAAAMRLDWAGRRLKFPLAVEAAAGEEDVVPPFLSLLHSLIWRPSDIFLRRLMKRRDEQEAADVPENEEDMVVVNKSTSIAHDSGLEIVFGKVVKNDRGPGEDDGGGEGKQRRCNW